MSGISLNLRTRLPGFELDVGWTAPAGFTVLFGYSGAGKSLTLASIAGTLRPDFGRVRVGEETFFDSRSGAWVAPQRRGVGFVTQNAQLFPHMTVRRNIAYALKGMPRAERAARIDEMLGRLLIEPLAEKYPHQLSGGQRQRAALARALAPRPRVLLLDEPLSALDLPVRVEMRELLLQTQRELGVPIVMVTHDLYEAAALADTLVVYSGEGTVQVGSVAELITDPGTPEIRRLLHSVELPASALAARGKGPRRVLPLTRKEHVA
jgi:molybdate transport system ATP-binding protein